MTTEEKISQLIFHSPAIERLGINDYCWWNEAAHGVARAGIATVFPLAVHSGLEKERHYFNATANKKDLFETYLKCQVDIKTPYKDGIVYFFVGCYCFEKDRAVIYYADSDSICLSAVFAYCVLFLIKKSTFCLLIVNFCLAHVVSFY